MKGLLVKEKEDIKRKEEKIRNIRKKIKEGK